MVKTFKLAMVKMKWKCNFMVFWTEAQGWIEGDQMRFRDWSAGLSKNHFRTVWNKVLLTIEILEVFRLFFRVFLQIFFMVEGNKKGGRIKSDSDLDLPYPWIYLNSTLSYNPIYLSRPHLTSTYILYICTHQILQFFRLGIYAIIWPNINDKQLNTSCKSATTLRTSGYIESEICSCSNVLTILCLLDP